MIEGETYFDRAADNDMRAKIASEREALEKLDVNRPPAHADTARVPTERREERGHDDTVDTDGGIDR